MLISTTTSPPAYPPPEQDKPITIEGISEFWFLIVALVSIVAYLVRLEIGVSTNRDRLAKVEDEVIPAINKDLVSVEANIENRIKEARAVFSVELQSALDAQKVFIQSRFDLILEKLSSRDTAIADLKEQSSRQGQELREMHGYCKRVDRLISKD